jgi:hypothetical protein
VSQLIDWDENSVFWSFSERYFEPFKIFDWT